MTRQLLRWHLWAWCMVTPAIAAVMVLALLERPAVPPQQMLPSWLVQPSNAGG
jgi:hypothetical protein